MIEQSCALEFGGALYHGLVQLHWMVWRGSATWFGTGGVVSVMSFFTSKNGDVM